ncbi:DUF4062 domain-containing protein [Microbispora sp. NPDC004025]
MAQENLRVFLSHTSELGVHPEGRSFVRVATETLLKAGHHPVDMAHFPARDQQAADYCREQVLNCDLYLGLIGFCYGSPVRDRPEVSYTQLEYLTAGAAGIPRLIFMLDPADGLPAELLDTEHGDRQRAFRRHVADEVLVQRFSTREQLEIAILHALVRFDEKPGTRASPVKRPWMAPAPTGPVVDRPGLIGPLVEALMATGAESVGVTTAVEGAGGFGKTTLTAQVSRMESRLAGRFPGGLLWVTLGQHVTGAELANRVNTLCEALTGRPSTTTDPELAGIRLGELLDQRPSTLLVVDDVWTAAQLKPFLIGGLGHRRLITTRIGGLVPPGAVSILVDAMNPDESRTLLRTGLGVLPESALARLDRLTGRWPVLLALANGLMAEYERGGASAAQAAEWVISKLSLEGPAALDIDNPEERAQAIAVTVGASMESLSLLDRERYLDLGIFPEDTDVPLDALTLLWSARSPMGGRAAERLLSRLVQSRLALGTWQSGPALRLHDVIRGYLRHQRSPSQLAQVNRSFVDAGRSLLTGEPEDGLSPWWSIPESFGYLWGNIVYHLAEAGHRDELSSLVTHPRWLVTRLDRFGAAAVDGDLAFAGRHADLRHALARAAHLLTPLSPSIVDTVASRLHGTKALRTLVRRLDANDPPPLLAPLWPLPDQPDAALRRTLEGHTGAVRACAVAADGTWMATGGFDRTVRIWDITGRSRSLVLRGHTGWIWDCAISPDGTWLASAGDDGTVRIWNAESGSPLRTLRCPDGVTGCAIAPDGAWLAATDLDGGIHVWNPHSGEKLRLLHHGAGVTGCAVAPDGTWLASAGVDGLVRVWDAATGVVRVTLVGHEGRVNGCAAAPDGMRLVSAGADGSVRVWEVAGGRQLALLEGHRDWVNDCAVAPDGGWLASTSADGTVRVWDAGTYQARLVLPGPAGGANACAIGPDSTWLTAGCVDRTVRIWEVARTDVRRREDSRIGIMRSCTASPSGELLAAGDVKGVTRVWNSDSQEPSLTLPGHEGWVRSCAFGADGAMLATGGADGRIRVWDVRRGALTHTMTGHEGWVNRLSFSATGMLLSAGSDQTLVVWDPVTGTRVARFDCAAPVFGGAIAPDGTWAAAGCADRTVQIWDVREGRRRLVLSGHVGRVNACVAGPDGRWLASAGFDRTARIWNVEDGALVAVLSGHPGPIWGMAASEDGALLMCVSTDGTAHVWDVASTRRLAAIRVDGPLRDCGWLLGGRAVCMAGDSGLYLFELRRPSDNRTSGPRSPSPHTGVELKSMM